MKKIEAINGLRGVAIIGVIYQHLFWETTGPGWGAFSVAGYEFYPFTLLSNGWVGVNLFFVLSGFVLFLPYADRSRTVGSFGDAWRFYAHRGRRLLPLYYFMIFLSMFFFYDIVHKDVSGIRNFILMVTATFNFTVDMWLPKYNPLLWSIGIEIWFCVLFPLLVVIAARTGLLRLFAALAAIALVVRIVGVHYESYFLIDSPYHNVLKDSLAGRIDDFAIGMLIASVYSTRLRDRPFARPPLLFAIGAALVLAGCWVWDLRVMGQVSAYMVPFTNNIFQAGFFLLVVSLLSMRAGVLRQVFTNRPLQVLGMMCYSVYIWHQQVIFAVIRENDYTAFLLTAYFAVLFTIAALTYRYVEFANKSTAELFLVGRTGRGSTTPPVPEPGLPGAPIPD